MVISCLYTYSMQRGTSPHGRQLCSQPEVSEAEGFRAAAAAAAWTPPVGVKWKVHRPYHLRITAGICKHKCVRSRVAVDFTLSSKTLLHRLRRRKKRNVVQAYNGRAQHPLHNASEHVPSASDIANLILFFVFLLLRSLRTVSSLTYRETSTCGTLCQEDCWSYQSTPLTSHISLSTTWD